MLNDKVTALAVPLAALFLLGASCTEGYVPGQGDSDVADGGFTDTSVDSGDISQRDMTDGSDVETGTDEDPDVGPDAPGDTGSEDPDGGSNTCSPEGDGEITRDEVPLEPELRATFEVARDVDVDTSGKMGADGPTWDYAKSFPGDHPKVVELESMDGQWFKPDFPEADYAMKLAGDAEELGVFDIRSEGLFMLGVVSPEDDGATTKISYDPAVAVLKFPLNEGETWKTETTASGSHRTWAPYGGLSYQETYTNQVDARGTLKTPYGEFDALRVRTKLERESTFNVPLATVRTFSFVAECFGTVATIRSDDDPDKTEFEHAAEIRRLTR